MNSSANWPNLFLAGVPKAGTSTVYNLLGGIPGIYTPRAKEPNYFDRVIIPDDYVARPTRDQKRYLSLYKNVKNERVVVDASAFYFYDPQAPRLISEVSHRPRILVSLRDPVERAFSQYLMYSIRGTDAASPYGGSFARMLDEAADGTFDPAMPNLRTVTAGYAGPLSAWIDAVGRRNVMVIVFEEWIRDQKKMVAGILDWLDITHDLEGMEPEHLNPFRVPRTFLSARISKHFHNRVSRRFATYGNRKRAEDRIMYREGARPRMDCVDRARLQDMLREDVRRTEGILGRRLPWENFDGGTHRR